MLSLLFNQGNQFIQVSVGGTLGIAGSLTKQPQTTKTGTLSMSGVLLKQAQTTKTGTLTSAGALIKQAQKLLSGTLTSSGSLIKQVQRTLSGTLTSSGALTATRIVLKALSGTLSMSGTLLKQVQTTKTGTLTSAGTLVKQVQRTLTGTLTSSGALIKQAKRTLAGTLTASGTIRKTAIKVLGGVLSFSGTVQSLLLVIRQIHASLLGRLTTFSFVALKDRFLLVGKTDAIRAYTAVRDFFSFVGRKDAFAFAPRGGTVPLIQDFTYPVGDDSDIKLTLKSDTGTPYDLTGCTVTFLVRYSQNKGGAVALTKTATVNDALNGLATLTLVPADTSGLLSGQYDFKIRVTNASSKVNTLITGVLTLADRRV